MSFVIVTDASSDFSQAEARDLGFILIPMPVQMDGNHSEKQAEEIAIDAFYQNMRKGQVVRTSQVTATQFRQVFLDALSKYDQVLYFGLSGGLSGTYDSANLAKRALVEEDPRIQDRLCILDSQSATGGLNILVRKAVKLQKEGKSMEEVAAFIQQMVPGIHHYLTVEDLVYLRRGGRISSFKAVAGTILNIKPLITVNTEGKLIPIGKAKGKKKSYQLMKAWFERFKTDESYELVIIGHGDSREDAEYVRDRLLQDYPIEEIIIQPVGPIVGCHGGPGSLVLNYYGKDRSVLNDI